MYSNELYFNSRPHEEVDLFIIRQCNTEPYFNSRPHEEVDCHCPDGSFCRKHFNSRPHEEVDRVNKGTFRLFCISTHDLTRRSTEGPVRIHTLAFISTHDLTRRSTSGKLREIGVESIFQLTTSRGGRHRSSAGHLQNFQFQLTTSRGGRLAQRAIHGRSKHFNSRPHEEVDILQI